MNKKMLDKINKISDELDPEHKKILEEESFLQTWHISKWHVDKMVDICAEYEVVDSSKILCSIMQGCRGKANPALVAKYIEERGKDK